MTGLEKCVQSDVVVKALLRSLLLAKSCHVCLSVMASDIIFHTSAVSIEIPDPRTASRDVLLPERAAKIVTAS